MQNIKFTYLYRDAGNYKQWAEIVFSNPDGLPLAEVDHSLRKAFFENDLFIAGQIRLPEIFPFTRGSATSDDHCFHEFNGVELTEENPDDKNLRTIKQLIADAQRASEQGWTAFDPH